MASCSLCSASTICRLGRFHRPPNNDCGLTGGSTSYSPYAPWTVNCGCRQPQCWAIALGYVWTLCPHNGCYARTGQYARKMSDIRPLFQALATMPNGIYDSDDFFILAAKIIYLESENSTVELSSASVLNIRSITEHSESLSMFSSVEGSRSEVTRNINTTSGAQCAVGISPYSMRMLTPSPQSTVYIRPYSIVLP